MGVLALADVGALPLPGAMVLAVDGDGSETQEPSWATASSAAALEDYLDCAGGSGGELNELDHRPDASSVASSVGFGAKPLRAG